MEYYEYEDLVTRHIEAICDCTRSDAQAVVETQQELINRCHQDNCDPMEVAIMVDKASAVAGPGKMKCKSCDGKGKWRIVARVIDKDGVHDAPPVWMDCHKCKGTGIKDIKEYEAEEKEWAEFWCSCGNPSGHSNRVDDYTPGAACAKHHYVCNDCGKVTQVG